MTSARSYWGMLAIGLLVLNHDFILFRHLFVLTDFWSSILKVVGLCAMVVSVVALTKYERGKRVT